MLLNFGTKIADMGQETSNTRTDFLNGRLKGSHAWKKLSKHVRHLFRHHLFHVSGDLSHGGSGSGVRRFGDDSNRSSRGT